MRCLWWVLILIKRENLDRDRDVYERGRIGVTSLRAPEAGGKQGRSLPRSFQGEHGPAGTLTLDLQPPEPRDSERLLL